MSCQPSTDCSNLRSSDKEAVGQSSGGLNNGDVWLLDGCLDGSKERGQGRLGRAGEASRHDAVLGTGEGDTRSHPGVT